MCTVKLEVVEVVEVEEVERGGVDCDSRLDATGRSV